MIVRYSRYDDPDKGGDRGDLFEDQRWSAYGLIIALIDRCLGVPSLIDRRDRSRGQIAGYLAYQIPCTLAIPVAAVTGLVLLLN